MSQFGVHCKEWKKTGALQQSSLPAHSTVEHTDTRIKKRNNATGRIKWWGEGDKGQGRGGSMGKITKDLSKKSNGNQML